MYSAHSYLGLTVVMLACLQYLLGAATFLWPKPSPHVRRSLSPVHAFMGTAVYVGGLAAIAVGIQEKATMILFQQKLPPFSAGMRLPAVLQVLVLLTGVSVLLIHSRAAVTG